MCCLRVLWFLLTVLYLSECKRGCQPDALSVYRVVLKTMWTEERFPKQYPLWRPPAQWSKLVGRSHDTSYTLFRVGETASEGLQEFAESGKSDVLDAQSQGELGIFDEFNAPPVTTGAGRTETEFFLDSNHSRVSLAVRLVPSPDWFVGVDSFDLCQDGHWLDAEVIHVGPLDAGTDAGYTFTAPNWPSNPQENIYRLTAHYPEHPANSFFYPDKKELPPIAAFHFTKVKEYYLSGVFQQAGGPNHHHHIQHNHGAVDDEEHHPNDIYNDINDSQDMWVVRRKKPRRGRKLKRRPRDCHVSEWSPWSSCSHTCGVGSMSRSRDIVAPSRRGGKDCPALHQSKQCVGPSCITLKSYFRW